VSQYGADQMAAGFRSMSMLAGLVQRGGRPAAVTPTVPLRAGEKQYGWFPVTVDNAIRRVAVLTNQRLIVGHEEFPLRSISRINPVVDQWSVALDVRGRAGSIELSGPWVPWMGVVICAELYGTAWPPHHHQLTATVPAQRRVATVVALCPAHRNG
jgi:hypothetical protein